MRIPYPERIPVQKAVYFVLVLFIIQWLEGTDLYFCIGTSFFILIATLTFNAAGGLTRATGAYVFFYSMIVVIIGLCYKAYLGEPAQSNLTAPQTDIAVYVGSIVAMYGAVILSRRFSRKTALLQNVLKERDMYRASVGCILFGSLASFGVSLLSSSAPGLVTIFAQVNLLVPLGIIIGVDYEIRSSGGTRCSNLFIVLSTAYAVFIGATGFSKEGMFTPLVCWLLPIWALKYRLSIVQVAFCCFMVFISFYYLAPFSAYGRNQISETTTSSEGLAIVVDLLEHPNRTRQAYLKDQANDIYIGSKGLSSYYDTPQGFWERLQFISVDDPLNHFTDQGHIFGLGTMEYGFINIIPHFLWPNKPVLNPGNLYVHEMTGQSLSEGDITTGISFSPSGEAYHVEGWAGIFILAPILWFMLFVIYDSLLGDVRSTPWGMLIVAIFSHSAPEGGLGGVIRVISFGVEALIFSAFFAAWFAPAFASLFLGPDRKAQQSQLPASAPSA